MPTFVAQTIGCKVNQYETQRLVEQLEALGWRRCVNGNGADLCIVNTCTVTEQADAKCRQALRRLRRDHPGALVVAAGCYPERDRVGLDAMPEVDRVLDNADKERLVEVLGLSDGGAACLPSGISRLARHARAFVKVQDGCDQFCTYCIVPYVRGRSRSRAMEEVLDEARRLVGNGYREIVLTGVHLGGYDDAGRRLPELVRALDAVDGLLRLRLSSIDPKEVTTGLVEAIASSRAACPHLHVSVQSGSTSVLERMNRGYTRDDYLAMAERTARAMPDLVLSTDLIVGFPGETDGEFADSLDLIERTAFGKVHVFPFSARPGTAAGGMPGRVPHDVVKARLARVAQTAQAAAVRCRERFIGRTVDVLVEGRTRNARHWHGFTSNYLKTLFALDNAPVGGVERVCVESCDAARLVGRVGAREERRRETQP
ncbi:MAG: tRNA (N(6)-L-threonylcarbamoyladenosine(37)-C(2))-methylthiotransferase MtaB [Verrucomicrobia bacterium]|nr:tRNA (N(6)-L-threonylcarbamoyladenosine(37)-C(2))-methylthiotransferase MtaB [Verrucomicrobiota bacterium]